MTPTPFTPVPLWKPSRQLLNQSTLKRYIDWLFVKKGLYFRNYDDLWDWSVTDLDHFWESISQFFDVQFTTPYHYVLQKPDDSGILGASWFGGATLNYAEHIFRQQTPGRPALLVESEQRTLQEISWVELGHQVAAVSAFLRARGVGMGDRVVAVLPTCPEAVVAFLATNAVGAVWSIGSPDFGTPALIDRFQPLEPKVLIALDGYTYNGRVVDKTEAMYDLQADLPTLVATIWLPYLKRGDSYPERVGTGGVGRGGASATYPSVTSWDDVLATDAPDGLLFEAVPFSHPIWVLYSSGSASKPKAITHSAGGCLLEHSKVLAMHQDVRPGDRYLWYSTTGWMMWNVALSSLLLGATLVLYDGAPAYPDLSRLWALLDRAQVNHFGGDATYFLTCMRSGMKPVDTQRLTALRTISFTGSSLPAEGFQWIYESVKPDVWLISLSGGTSVCSGLVGGNPLLPVYTDEIQCRLLGCKVDSLDKRGRSVRNRPGEMVVLQPMPSMPLHGWDDRDNGPYRSRFLKRNPAVWWHGDWITITDRNTVILYGRSEATLVSDGRRLGTAEIYNVVELIPNVIDSLVVGVDRPGDTYFTVLFVVLRHGVVLDQSLEAAIRRAVQSRCKLHHFPTQLIQVAELPYTISGRKLELPVRKLLSGTDASLVVSRDTLRNPAALDAFADIISAIMARW